MGWQMTEHASIALSKIHFDFFICTYLLFFAGANSLLNSVIASKFWKFQLMLFNVYDSITEM